MSLRRRRGALVESLESRTLLSATDVDSAFGTNGTATANFNGGFDNARAVAVQKDGKVIVAGEAGSLGFAAVRFNADGTLDDGGPDDSTPGDHFGTGGKFTYVPSGTTNAGANAVAVQKDGKIVIAGTAYYGSQQSWILLRLNVDGSFDQTFGFDHGVGGLQFSIYSTPLTGMAIQNDGKIVVCGSANADFLVGRFTATGEMDDDFGTGGTVTTDFGGIDAAGGLAVDNIGKIVVVGTVKGSGSLSKLGMARYLPNGDLDKTFGVAGLAVDSGSGAQREVTGVAIRPNGHLVVSNSELESFNGATWSGLVNFYDDTGHLEGGGGGRTDGWKFNAIAIMPNGNFAVAATKLGASSNTFAYSIETFGEKQRSLGTSSLGTAVAVAPNGNVFVAGAKDGSGFRDFAVVKLDGVDPSSYGIITGNVFNDTDGDHVKDSNEKGMAHVRVYFDTNGDGKWDQIADDEADETFVYTDINGNYSIPNLAAGTYPLRQALPNGYVQETPTSAVLSTKVRIGQTTKNVNFMNQPIATDNGDTIISGSVFNDWNGNAKRDIAGPIEPDLPKMVVFVDSNKNGKLDSKETRSTTDAGGNYQLKVAKGGTYRIAVVVPSGWINTTPSFVDTKVATGATAIDRFALTALDKDDSIAEVAKAKPLSVGSTISKSLSSALDVNLYRFTVKAGQKIGFDLDAIGGSSLNSYLRLFDSAGKLLKQNDDGAAPGEGASIDSYLQYTFKTAGTYYIAVSDHLNKAYNPKSGAGDIGGGTKGKYSLSLISV